MKNFLPLTLMTCGLLIVVASSNPLIAQETIPQEERQALVDLYNQCDGGNWRSSYRWNLEQDPSTWKGVTIKGGHVTEINLRAGSLKGELPESIGNLKELTKLELSSNRLSGNLPQGLFKLPKLFFLNLQLQTVRDEYTLKGHLPEEIDLPMLQHLYLGNNALSGSLPEKVNMPKVQVVLIGSNNFTGPIPEAWSNFPEVMGYDLSNNNFTGDFNMDFSKMPKLSQLIVGGAEKGNKGLTGTLNPNIFDLSLILLEIQNTGISGSLNNDLSKWSGMQQLLLFGSKFTGPLPASFAEMTQLKMLNLAGGNSFTGPLPDLSRMTGLTHMILSGNKFGGEIPSWLPSMHNLTECRMADCGLSGRLLPDLAPSSSEAKDGLWKCAQLDFAGNQLTGEIPEQWGNFKRLITLSLSNNQLSGSPISTILNMSNLSGLYIQNNNFTGSVGRLFDSEIETLGRCNISGNHFSGDITTQAYTQGQDPFSKFYNGGIDLSNNDFTFESFQNLGMFLERDNEKIIYAPMNRYNEGDKLEISDSHTTLQMSAPTGAPKDIDHDDAPIELQYQWYHNNERIPAATLPTLTIDQPKDKDKGIYHCIVTCSIAPSLQLRSGDYLVHSSLGTLPIETASEALCVLDGEICYAGASELRLFTLQGELIQLVAGDRLQQLQQIPSGSYILVVSSSTGQTAYKINF